MRFQFIVPLLAVVTLCKADETENKKPVFLFGGQSNMEGVFDEQIFQQILSITTQVGIPNSHKTRKIAAILNQVVPDVDRTIYEPISMYEAKYLINLRKEGLMRRVLNQNLTGVDCTFIRPSSIHGTTSTGPNIVSPFAECGFPFGPELMFGHTMYKKTQSPYFQNPFSILKVASGGTQLRKDWMKEGGNHWWTLANAIHSLDSSTHKYEAFVWFQGENDSMDEENSSSYFDNLTQFVDNVRQEMLAANGQFEMDTHSIPVVIVQLGGWANGFENGPTLLEAQQMFVDKDPNAALVITKDLSHYYHYEAAAQLIIGERVAKALMTLI
jgi:hypothetical protein